MSTPEEVLKFPTIEGARISPIESPSSTDMYSTYGDIVHKMMGIDGPIDDLIRAAASQALNHKFFENPDVSYGSEVWLTGAKAAFTHDKTMIKELATMDDNNPMDEDELPDTIGFALSGLEELQGFFGTFTTGPIMDIETQYSDYLDFSFCVNLENPVIKTPANAYGEPLEFLLGNWLVVLSDNPTIGTVSS